MMSRLRCEGAGTLTVIPSIMLLVTGGDVVAIPTAEMVSSFLRLVTVK